jgi:[acyl-carrier-protein] S-malonyltransferase
MEKVAVLFPGQGTQYSGMGTDLYSEFKTARQVFAEAGDVLGFNLKQLCFKGGLVKLNKMEYMFPALLTFAVAAFRVYTEEIGIIPHFSAGHSLGEYSALVCSGVMNFRDALRIVHERGMLAREAAARGTGAMTVVNGVHKAIVERECRKVAAAGKIVSVSCYNSPCQVVISGQREAVREVEDAILRMASSPRRETPVQATPLLKSPPLHCPLMQASADKLKLILEKYPYSPSRWPVISNCIAQPYHAPGDVISHLTRQLVSPVLWEQTMEYLLTHEVDVIIDMGPQAVLTNIARSSAMARPIHIISFGQKDDRQKILEQFHAGGKLTIPSPALRESDHSILGKCLAEAVCTRNRNWDKDEYQKKVVDAYERIERMQDEAEERGTPPSIEQMNQALLTLRSIFETKRVPVNEQVDRFRRIVTGTGTEYLLNSLNLPGLEKKACP